MSKKLISSNVKILIGSVHTEVRKPEHSFTNNHHHHSMALIVGKYEIMEDVTGDMSQQMFTLF